MSNPPHPDTETTATLNVPNAISLRNASSDGCSCRECSNASANGGVISDSLLDFMGAPYEFVDVRLVLSRFIR